MAHKTSGFPPPAKRVIEFGRPAWAEAGAEAQELADLRRSLANLDAKDRLRLLRFFARLARFTAILKPRF
jgi:hypothetical protein